ncbi:MAG TPA: hypothetical protein GXZ65_06795 [Clostridiales bacterium]|jgi:hypothetical protein|nr:hypothetical protein [Clostridiales bacterium]
MIGLFRSWILGLTAASIIAAVLISISPAGKPRKITTFAAAFMLVVAMVKPILSFDFSTFQSSVLKYGVMAEDYSSLLKEENYRLMRVIIEERSSAYISDKAKNIGIEDIAVTVLTQKGDDGYPYPQEVSIEARCTQAQKTALTDYIESEFGVPKSKQHWSVRNGN